MKVKAVRIAHKKDTVYDIETPSHSYLLGNGIISHNTMEMYSKKVVSGGQGWVLSSNSIFIMGKRQVKDGSELAGFEFVMNTDKSRFIKEKSSIPITVTFDGGIDRFSGLLDVAVATGHVVRPNNRTYLRKINGVLDEETKWTKRDLNCAEFWDDIINDESFKSAVQEMYSLTSPKTFSIDEKGEATLEDVSFDPETGEIFED